MVQPAAPHPSAVAVVATTVAAAAVVFYLVTRGRHNRLPSYNIYQITRELALFTYTYELASWTCI